MDVGSGVPSAAAPGFPAACCSEERRKEESTGEESRRVKRGTEEKSKHPKTIIVLAKGKMLTGGIVTGGRAAGATANGALPVREMANDDVVNGQTAKGCATCPPA